MRGRVRDFSPRIRLVNAIKQDEEGAVSGIDCAYRYNLFLNTCCLAESVVLQDSVAEDFVDGNQLNCRFGIFCELSIGKRADSTLSSFAQSEVVCGILRKLSCVCWSCS